MNNTKILAAAARRWPQELQEPAFREWCAELAAMDRFAPNTLRNRWRKSRFVWSLLMSKPPQASSASASRLPRFSKDMNALLGLSFGFGTVFSWGYTAIHFYVDVTAAYPWFYLPLVAVTGIAGVALFRGGQRWTPSIAMRSTKVVMAVMLGGIVANCLGRSVILGPVLDPLPITLYGAGLILLLIVGIRAVRMLRSSGRGLLAGVLTVAVLYCYFSVPYLWYSLANGYGLSSGFEFSAFFVPYDSGREVLATALVGPLIPLVAFLAGRAFGALDEEETAAPAPK